ncbi:hypothetical protein NDU88_007489 [Pleurodeles waltl]|uniref:Uncharacterized protein n=1 Tax=Pleurodeles waltl TaxID=8319 RepID=A0AAV7NT77_PLEWA|nr:hypothetical protein NDU88_007489 [Pleurodeles waltl]
MEHVDHVEQLQPLHEGTQNDEPTPQLLWVPEFIPRSTTDILNRSSILRLIKALPDLQHVGSDDIAAIKFIQARGCQHTDPTLSIFADPALPMQILERKDLLKTWGIEVSIYKGERYPPPLLASHRLETPKGMRSVLHGACAATPDSRGPAKTILEKRLPKSPLQVQFWKQEGKKRLV